MEKARGGLFGGDDRRQMERRRESDELFKDFWAAYPRKVGRVAAKREWDRIRPTAEVVKQMADALEWQREQWDDPKFIPHPRTWLHNQRWEDERPEPREAKPKTSGNLQGIETWMRKRAAGQ